MPDNDTMTWEGANALAKRITAFWQRRGVQVRTRIEPSTGPTMGQNIWVVRSDLGRRLCTAK